MPDTLERKVIKKHCIGPRPVKPDGTFDQGLYGIRPDGFHIPDAPIAVVVQTIFDDVSVEQKVGICQLPNGGVCNTKGGNCKLPKLTGGDKDRSLKKCVLDVTRKGG